MKVKLIFLAFFVSSVVAGQIPEKLPSILNKSDGRSITDVHTWEEQRRPELLELFYENVYGSFPKKFNPEVSFETLETDFTALDGKAIRKQVRVYYENRGYDSVRSMDILIYLPANNVEPVPLFLGLNFYGNHTIHPDTAILVTDSWVKNNESFMIFNNEADENSRGVRVSRWPVEYILSRGYGLATIYYGDIDPDYHDDFQNGLHDLFREDGPYPENGAASISAWAYGLSRALDYLLTDPYVDHSKVAVIGHSRLGKAALWAGATDDRFAFVISNNSGCGGAALSMRKKGETVKAINDRFPHWFCGNFKTYNNNEESLPVDQHMLLSLIAPRKLYVASASEDAWADPYGEQLSAFLASKVYELYGLDVKIPFQPVIVNMPVKTGAVGYHLRLGSHDITAYDWEQYLDFLDFHTVK